MSITVGFFGGSFNPVHAGHLMLAQYIAEFGPVDEVWMSLSPSNPLRQGRTDLVQDSDRLAMLKMAAEGLPRVKVTDVELAMPRPSYTVDTLRRLSEMYPERNFRLMIGSDNWALMDRWRDPDVIISRFAPIIYPRPGSEDCLCDLPAGVSVVDAPRIDISSTWIREAIATGHRVDAFLPHGVAQYIDNHSLYR